jgi:hypothetical protein
MRGMAHIPLKDFIGTYRDELIRRCQVKVVSRVLPLGSTASGYGVPLFLNQLCEQLRDGASQSDANKASRETDSPSNCTS